jgi:hypothetical protein
MFAGTLAKGKRIDGYLRNGLITVEIAKDVAIRHDVLAEEMESRGYNHDWDKKLKEYSLSEEIIEEYKCLENFDKDKSLLDLLERCPTCKKRWEKLRPSCSKSSAFGYVSKWEIRDYGYCNNPESWRFEKDEYCSQSCSLFVKGKCRGRPLMQYGLGHDNRWWSNELSLDISTTLRIE